MQDSAAVSAELARIESAMTRIRLRTETTGDVIEDVATAVENMVTDTGAFKVSSVEEMNALEDMKVGDYCIIQGQAEYVIPETATFTRFTGNGTDILNGVYDNYLFLIAPLGNNDFLKDNTVTDYDSLYKHIIALDHAELTNVNDSFTLNKNTFSGLAWQFIKKNNNVFLKSVNGKTMFHCLSYGGTTYSYSNSKSGRLAADLVYSNPNLDFYISSIDFNANTSAYKILFKVAGHTSDNYYLRSQSKYNGTRLGWSNTTSVNNNTYLYACRLETTTVDHLVYEYRENTGWVDVTDDILVPTTNITPTTSSQTLTIPAGYRGFKIVNVSAIDNTIDANIIAENIKKGVTILGITGTYEGIVPADEYDYQLETAKDIAGIQEQGGDN